MGLLDFILGFLIGAVIGLVGCAVGVSLYSFVFWVDPVQVVWDNSLLVRVVVLGLAIVSGILSEGMR